MVLEIHVKLCLTEPDLPEKSKIGKKQFFKYFEKFCHQSLLNLFCNENLYYLLFSCTNPLFGKILVPEIWTKMFSANQIAGFFNQPYLQNKSMK